MKFRGWFRRLIQKRRWRKAERTKDPLREFVYLDDVSVYSLVASQVGLIVTELTETQATSLQSEVSSGIGVSAPLKAEIGSKVQAGETNSTQVLRKAIIQTTFKQLHGVALRSGALRIRVDGDGAPTVKTVADVRRLISERSSPTWVIDPRELHRGDLIEMDVRLEAEPIFQASTVISDMLEIVSDDPAAFGLRDLGELGRVRLVSKMLDKVLAGLVPVRGRAIDYDMVEIDGTEWLLHTAVVKQLQETVATRPVFVVGVAQEALFWKDTRRVLFSESSYRVLARLNRSGVQQSWTPIKLVDVLRDVIPDFAQAMDAMNRGFPSGGLSTDSSRSDNRLVHAVQSVATSYAMLLGDRVGIHPSRDELNEAGLLDFDRLQAEPTIQDWREILSPITSFIEDRSGRHVDPEVAADCRLVVIATAGLSGLDLAPDVNADFDKRDERFLDSDFVAMYW